MKKVLKSKFLSSFVAVLLALFFLTVLQILFPAQINILDKPINLLRKPFNSLFSGSEITNNSLAELEVENKLLRDSIRSLTVDYVRLEILEKENKELKEITKIYTAESENLIIAEIVGQQKINNSRFIVINKGLNSGIEKGMPVTVGNVFLLGIIAYASNDTSYVVLPNDSTVNLSAKILNSNQPVQGVVEGQAGLSINFELIAKETLIQIGDVVVTSGIDLGIPGNLIIGRIAAVNDSNNNFFKSAVIEPLALPSEYKFITIIKSNQFTTTSTDILNYE